MKQRIVLTSPLLIGTLINKKRGLLEIPGLAGLKHVVEEMDKASPGGKGCNCVHVVRKSVDSHKAQIEAAISNLSAADYTKMKSVLAINEICYYTKNQKTNRLELICL